MTSFYNREELSQIGFKSVGDNVQVSRFASFYGVSRISIGNNVRIDDFCVLSTGTGGIQIGDFVHIAVFALLIGEGRITLEDFSCISSKAAVYSSNGDYSGEFLSNPTVPAKYTGVIHADVTLGRHALVCSGSLILPGVTIKEGAVVGALSLVNKDCEEYYIYKGNPAKKIVKRSREFLKLEKEFLNTL